MKFYRAMINYEEIYYDNKRTINSCCLNLNNEFWNTEDSVRMIIIKTTCESMTGLYATDNLNVKEKDIIAVTKKYLKKIDVYRCRTQLDESKINKIKEITLNSFVESLNEYSMDNLFEDKDLIRKQIGVDSAYSTLLKEELLDIESFADKGKRQYLFDKNELNRIKTGHKIKEPVMAPVNYIIYENDEEIRKCVYEELVRYLWNQGRICNRRVVKINDNEKLTSFLTKKAFNLNSLDGGLVVVEVSSDVETAKTYFDLVSEDRNGSYSDKYTIIILTDDSNIEDYTEALRESFYSLVFHPIYCQRLNIKMAKDHFKELLKDDGISANQKEWEQCFTEDTYTYYEVGRIYKRWVRSIYHINNNFTQYKNIVDEYFNSKIVVNSSAREELNELVGLEKVKQLIEDIVNYQKIEKLRQANDKKEKGESMHMVFTGNPGTAKTTVARLVARILKEEGILSKGELIEVGRSDLVGKYVGWTAKTVKEYFQKARGSVLFIDEAYSLDDKQGSFGDEAINTIVQEMENYRDQVVVIMAGYRKEMEHFLQKNSGMVSRIKFLVDFPDYSRDEMYEILELMAIKEGMYLSTDVKDVFFQSTAKNQYQLGNGRSVRNMYERAKMRQSRRLLVMDKASMEQEMNILTGVDFND